MTACKVDHLQFQSSHSIEEDKTCRADSTMLKVHALKECIAKTESSSSIEGRKITPCSSPFANLSEQGQQATSEFIDYAFSPSEFAAQAGVKATHIDVLFLFIEILKLSIKERELQKISRSGEKESQLAHMMKVVDNFREQGKWVLSACVLSGALGIFSGASPLIGHLWGDELKNALGSLSFFSDVKTMEKKDFTEMMMKLSSTMSDVSRQTEQVQNKYAESDRFYDEGWKQIHETNTQERTRTLEESLQEWRSMENFLSQQLQWQHDAARSLYTAT